MIMSGSEEMVALIEKCLKGDATGADLARLEEWVSSSAENKRFFLEIKNVSENSNNSLNINDIDIDRALLNVGKELFHTSTNTKYLRFLQKAAAILLIPLIGASFFIGRSLNLRNLNASQKTVLNEVTAAFGTRSAVMLSDGSKVWLNAGSSMLYPDRFTKNTREVFLRGEAYFEVKSDPSNPFIVRSKDMDVRATGTEFNVCTTSKDKVFEVVLVSGKVSVSRTHHDEKPVIISEMIPSQYMVYDSISGKVDIKVEDTYKFIAWKDGKLVFRNDPLSDVMEKIGYFYNVDIELRGDELKNYPYRATLEQETISEILKLLKHSSPIDYIELPRKLLPDGTFAKKQIIIFPANEKI